VLESFLPGTRVPGVHVFKCQRTKENPVPQARDAKTHSIGVLQGRQAHLIPVDLVVNIAHKNYGGIIGKAVTLALLMQTTHERIVVSVGGSLIVPDGIDTEFLTQFKLLILEKVQKGLSFTIIAGGGKVCRRYQEAANSITPLSSQDLDWLGIHVTRLNAQLLRNIFAGYAHQQVIKNPTIDIEAEEPIIIAAGWQPGCSTDYDAVLMAKNLGARRLVNLSNIDYVYDSDPKKNPGAKKIEKSSWTDFRKLLPEKWDPGLSSPFDPIAAREAETLGLEVAVINGTKLEEFSNYLDNKPFIGTVIS